VRGRLFREAIPPLLRHPSDARTPRAMAFWGPDSSLPIELRVAAVLADERLELREDRERAREDVAHRKGTIAPANTLESLDRGAPALRTWRPEFIARTVPTVRKTDRWVRRDRGS